MADRDFSDGRWYASYVLLIAGLVSVMNYYDRFLLAVLVEPVKRDLDITDGQVGILAGIGFALMYGILGVPIARFADRYGRTRVLAGVLTLWSAMTAFSGAATNFAIMLFARAGVGIGEAGGMPTVHALVADYFPPRRRGLALSTIGVCGALGMSLALGVGGLIADRWGWRMAFYLGGIPGAVLAALVFFTIREPRSRKLSSEAVSLDMPTLGASFKLLWGRKSFVLLCLGVGIAAISGYGIQVWSPAFLMRTYGMTAGEVGAEYSMAIGPVIVIAILLGGGINDWLLRRDPRWPVWLLVLSFGLSVPLNLAFFLVHDFMAAMILVAASTLIGNLWVGPAYAIVQNLAGPKLRALSAAIFMMVVNIIGLGVGPVIPGLLSDALAPHFGASSLMISLCFLSAGAVVSILPFLMAACTIGEDVIDANR